MTSRAAGWSGTTEESGQPNVGVEIAFPVLGGRPRRVLQQRLPPQLVGNAQPLDSAAPGNPLAPERVLGRANRRPIAIDELANPPRDHRLIVSRFRRIRPMPADPLFGDRNRAACTRCSDDARLGRPVKRSKILPTP